MTEKQAERLRIKKAAEAIFAAVQLLEPAVDEMASLKATRAARKIQAAVRRLRVAVDILQHHIIEGQKHEKKSGSAH